MKNEKVKKQRIEKGQWNYINTRKRAQGVKSLLMFLCSAAIYILGLCLNKFQKDNVFTIIAALSVLPAAKMLISYIVLAPYHTVPRELYDKVVKQLREGDICFTDVVFTSSEKVMFLAFVIITGNELIGLAGRGKENTIYMKQYLDKAINVRTLDYQVTLCSEESQFLSYLSKCNRSEVALESQNELTAYLKSIMV